MKKTIIALAALAATGASFAQSVTLSGKFGVSYIKQSQFNGAATNPLGTARRDSGNLAVTDGDIRFVATEDLGNGMKAGADIEIRIRGRQAADEGTGIGARNATVSLAGGFGTVALGSVELGNGIKARGWAGAPIGIAFALEGGAGGWAAATAPAAATQSSGKLGGPLSSAANANVLLYTTPEVLPGLKFGYTRADDIGNPGQANGTPAGINADALHIYYVQGPVNATYDYTQFDYNNGNASSTTPIGAKRERHRISASVDLGVVAVGAGYEDNKQAGNPNFKAQYTAGVKVPMGALTLGAVYASAAKAAALNGSNAASGYGVAAEYAFSKRTNINVTYLDHSGATGTSAAALNSDQYQVRLMHSF